MTRTSKEAKIMHLGVVQMQKSWKTCRVQKPSKMTPPRLVGGVCATTEEKLLFNF